MLSFKAGKAAHATAIVVGETGILFTGASGTGKSATALACIDAARQRGWHAALVADDGVILECAGGRPAPSGRIIARCPEPIAGKAEIRGSGIVTPAFRRAARIHLAVAPGSPTGAGRLPPTDAVCRVGDASLPLVFLRYDIAAPLPALELLARELGLAIRNGN